MEQKNGIHLRILVQQLLLPMMQGTFQGDSKTRDILSRLCDSIKTILPEERYKDLLRDPILYQDQILEVLKELLISDKNLQLVVSDLTNRVSRKQETPGTAMQSITVNGNGNQTIVAGRDLTIPGNIHHPAPDTQKKSRLNETFSHRKPAVLQIDLHLETLGSGDFKIHCKTPLSGEVLVESKPPYNSDDLDAVLELLEYMNRDFFRLRKLQAIYQRLGRLMQPAFYWLATVKYGFISSMHEVSSPSAEPCSIYWAMISQRHWCWA
jgi:hypothetical protein